MNGQIIQENNASYDSIKNGKIHRDKFQKSTNCTLKTTSLKKIKDK